MTCNHCGDRMVPSEDALVPAMECVGCGRLTPRTGVSHRHTDKRALNRALRAARRQKIAEGRA